MLLSERVDDPDLVLREDVLHLRGRGRGGQVQVVGQLAAQQVADGAAGEAELEGWERVGRKWVWKKIYDMMHEEPTNLRKKLLFK